MIFQQDTMKALSHPFVTRAIEAYRAALIPLAEGGQVDSYVSTQLANTVGELIAEYGEGDAMFALDPIQHYLREVVNTIVEQQQNKISRCLDEGELAWETQVLCLHVAIQKRRGVDELSEIMTSSDKMTAAVGNTILSAAVAILTHTKGDRINERQRAQLDFWREFNAAFATYMQTDFFKNRRDSQTHPGRYSNLASALSRHSSKTVSKISSGGFEPQAQLT